MGIIKNKNSEVKLIKKIENHKIPVHIGIIMDGNGRWAKKRHLPRSLGHRQGAQTLKKITQFCEKIGVKYLTCYAFSTENWKRPQKEVDYLMNLLEEYLKDAPNQLAGKDTRIRIIGQKDKLNDKILKLIESTENMTQDRKGLTLVIALNYGSRQEIQDCIKDICLDVVNEKIGIDSNDEEIIKDHLYTRDIPDPDIIIRPSGEKRLSNFLLYQAAYSEFWFSSVYWPDFKANDIVRAIKDYNKRERRFGGV